MRPTWPQGTVAAVCLAAILAVTSPAAAVETVADCRTLVDQHPNDLNAYRCYWVVARQHNLWQEAIDGIGQILADDERQPRALLYLGMIYTDRGDPGAENVLRQAASAFASEGEPTGEVYSLLALAHWLDRRERIEESGETRRRAAEVAAASGDPILLARGRLAQAWQSAREKDFATARAFFLEVEAVVFPEGPFDMQYGSVSGLGYTAWATGRYRSALATYRRQADLCAKGGDVFEQTTALYNAAFMASQIAQTTADIQRIDMAAEEALDAALLSGDKELEARLRLMLAQPHDGSPGRRAEASRALEAAGAAGIPELELQAVRAIALHDLAARPHEADAPLARLREAVVRAGELESLDQQITGRIVLAGALWFHGDPEESFRESSLVLDLIDELRARQSADEERARIASTWSHAFYQPSGRLLTTGEPADIETALLIMERLRGHDLVDVLEAAEAPTPKEFGGTELSLDAIRRALAANEILVSYQLADQFDLHGGHQGGSWVILITCDGAEAVPLPDRREINAAVEVFLGLVRRNDPREPAAAHRLFQLILGAARDRLTPGPVSLTVVPDGVLTAVPFAALRPDPGGGPPLIDRATVTIVPSISRWLAGRSKAVGDDGNGYLGVADPILDEYAETLQPLPHARAEIQRASRRLGTESLSVTGTAATESAVKELILERFRVIHFATHAEVDRDDPSRTAILLARGSAVEDGRLEIAEISSLDLGQPMVILSACRSAGGVVLQGEGVIGLTRAFFEGGARTVVGNLWPVSDQHAANLMERFIRHLASGSPVAEALSQAQRDRWRAGDPVSAWASLVAIGDGRLVTGAGPRASAGLVTAIVLASIVVLVAAFVLLRARSR